MSKVPWSVLTPTRLPAAKCCERSIIVGAELGSTETVPIALVSVAVSNFRDSSISTAVTEALRRRAERDEKRRLAKRPMADSPDAARPKRAKLNDPGTIRAANLATGGVRVYQRMVCRTRVILPWQNWPSGARGGVVEAGGRGARWWELTMPRWGNSDILVE